MKKQINFKILSYALLLMLLVLCTEDDPIEFRLTTNCVPEKTGAVSPESGMFTEGAEIQLKATANPEYIFKNWEGDAVGDANPLEITMTKNKAITAVFEKVNYSLNIEVIGQGTVNQEMVLAKSSSTDYESGTIVQLTANPENGWRFVEWSGDLNETENPVQITMDQYMNIVANFEQPKTFVPDDNFEQELILRGIDDVLDDYVVTNNISRLKVLSLDGLNIKDLTGIEDFSELEELSCTFNSLTNIDLSQNTKLVHLSLQYNEILKIDLSSNTNLKLAMLHNNKLNEMILDGTELLETLDCSLNMLGPLDFSKSPNISYLNCSGNPMNEIDLKELVKLESLVIINNYFNEVDLSKNINLKELYCSNGQITSLILNGANQLEELQCQENNLSEIDISDNPLIAYLKCHNNRLKSLDISRNKNIFSIDARNNLLETLNLKNGTNQNLNILVKNNPLLNCIQVDNPEYSTTNWDLNLDPHHFFSEDCGY